MIGRRSLPGWVSNWRPEVGNGEYRSVPGFMKLRLWLYANTEFSCYPFVAGVIVVSINTLGMCQTVGKKKCVL